MKSGYERLIKEGTDEWYAYKLSEFVRYYVPRAWSGPISEFDFAPYFTEVDIQVIREKGIEGLGRKVRTWYFIEAVQDFFKANPLAVKNTSVVAEKDEEKKEVPTKGFYDIPHSKSRRLAPEGALAPSVVYKNRDVVIAQKLDDYVLTHFLRHYSLWMIRNRFPRWSESNVAEYRKNGIKKNYYVPEVEKAILDFFKENPV